jgi:hypothetical protein
MKKIIFATAMLLALTTAKMQAQTSETDWVHYEASLGTGLRNNGVRPLDFSFKLSVNFLSVSYIFVAMEDNISLSNGTEMRSYTNGTSGGGGLGIKLLNGKSSDHALDLRLKVLDTLGRPSWKRMTYDASLAWYLKSQKFSPVVELGYRYIKSKTTGIDNYGDVYVSVGLRY